MRTKFLASRTGPLALSVARFVAVAGVALVAGTALGADAAVTPAVAPAKPVPATQPVPVTTPTPTAAPVPAAAPAATIPVITEQQLLARQAKHDPSLVVLDVRTPKEYAEGHVPGAVNISHDQVASRLAEIPRDKDVVLYCHSGRRAGMAADVLKSNGYSRLYHLEGDMMGWVAQKQPLEK
jgi:rhodanese-related sulfurtransferase